MKQTVQVTIYHQEEDRYIRKVYEDAFWDDDMASNIAKTGLSNADRLYVSIPLKKAPDLSLTIGRDLIVKGNVELEFDNTSQATQLASLKTLKSLHEVFTITAVSKKDHGSERLRHWELSGK